MSKNPVKVGKREARTIDRETVERVRTASEPNPFFSFRYSYKEISAFGGMTHVKSKEMRFEDGKLTSEAFEGTLGRDAYDDMVRQAQRHFLNQTALFLKSLSLFLPFSTKQPLDDD